jgi:Family of unknown function (DUF6489)
MKIRIEMDMTPDEARRTMGLPDVSGMQDKLVAQMEKRLLAALDTSDPQAMLKSWFPPGSQGFEQFQKFMWDSARQAAGAASARKDKVPR